MSESVKAGLVRSVTETSDGLSIDELSRRILASIGPRPPMTPVTFEAIADTVSRFMAEHGLSGQVPIFEITAQRRAHIGDFDVDSFRSAVGRHPLLAELQALNGDSRFTVPGIVLRGYAENSP